MSQNDETIKGRRITSNQEVLTLDFSTGGLILLKGNGETPICYTDTCGDIYSDLLNKFTTNVARGAELASIVTNLRHHIFLNGD